MTESMDRSRMELDTPRLVIDADRMEANIRAFHQAVLSNGSAIRSHVKTHKTPEIARLQVEAGAVGIAAAKVSEAEVFVDQGIEDVVVAYPVFGSIKWARLAGLAARCDRLVVHAENEAAIVGLSEAAVSAGVSIGIRIEIDSGFHRTGVDVEDAIDLGRVVQKSPGLWLDGVTTHRSMFFPEAGGRDPAELGGQEGRLIVEVAEAMRAGGLEIPHVVAGSTPTGRALAAVDGITEVCAGTYVFYDAGMADLGVVPHDEVALTIKTTVVAQMGSDRYTIDGGAKTFTKETYPGAGAGVFGRAVERPDWIVGLTDEHGIVQTSSDSLPELGEVVSFHPMHVCPVVNLADELVVTRGGNVEAIWHVAARGCNR